MPGTSWTVSDKKLLSKLWGDVGVDSLALIFKRTPGAVYSMAAELHLKRLKPIKKMKGGWSDREILELYEYMTSGLTARATAAKLGRARGGVIGKATRLWGQYSSVPEESLVRLPKIEKKPPPEVKVLPIKPYHDRQCASCEGTRQPGRDYCASCLTASYVQRQEIRA